MTQHLAILSIVVLFLGGFLTAIFGNNKTLRNIILLTSTSASFIFVMLLIKPIILNKNIITYWMGNWAPENGWAIGIGLEIDGLGILFGLIASIAILISGIYSIKYMSSEDNLEKYNALFLMLSGSILGLIFTGDLFNMFIMIEIMTLASVGLTAFRNKSKGAFAAFKLVIAGSLGSFLILLGIIMLYAQFHTLNMAQLAAMLHNNYTPVTLFAFASLLGGFAAKTSLVSSHTIIPDIYETAPSSISTFFCGIVDKAGLYGIIRTVFIIYTSMNLLPMRFMFIFLGAVAMIFGVIMALVQKDLNRLLAYHSISQMGYVFVGLGLATAQGLTGGLYHALNNALFMGLLFLCSGAIEYTTGTTDLNGLGGLAKKMPQTALLFSIAALSIGGLPFFNGFVSKWLIYKGAFESGYYVISILAVLTSILTIVSFIKTGRNIFFGELPREYDNIKETPFQMRIPMWIMAVLCFLTGIIPGYITRYLINPAAASVLNVQKYIDTMMGTGFAEKWFGEPLSTMAVSNSFKAYYGGIAWLIIYAVVLTAFTIAAAAGKLRFENTKVNMFLDRLKQYFNRFYKFMQKADSYTVNDCAVWVISMTSIVLVYLFIFV